MMKTVNLLVWLTQLGLSVAVPPTVYIFFAVWLRNAWGWGDWVIWVAAVLGVYSAIQGLRVSLKAMERLAGDDQEQQPPPVSFNEHN